MATTGSGWEQGGSSEPPRHGSPPKRRGPIALAVVFVVLGAAAGASAVVRSGDGGGGGGGGVRGDGGGAATGPVDLVTTYHEARLRGDCATAAELGTVGLREEERRTGRCLRFAELLAQRSAEPAVGPDDADPAGSDTSPEPLPDLPEVRDVHLTWRSGDLAVVDVTFGASDGSELHARRAVVRQPGGRWAVATDQEAHDIAPGLVDVVESDPGSDAIVFVDRNITVEQRAALETALAARTEVLAFEYFDRRETVAEARRIFAGDQEMLDRLADIRDGLPTSYRLLLASIDPTTVYELAEEVRRLPGVVRVVDSRQRAAELPEGPGSAP